MSKTSRRRSALLGTIRDPLTALAIGTILSLILIGLIGPFFLEASSIQMTSDRLAPPSGQHLLGTDGFGRDVLSRFVVGARVSTVVGLAGVLPAVVIGSALGIAAGMRFGSWLDILLMRLMDVVLILPMLVVIPIMVAFLRNRELASWVPEGEVPVIAFVVCLVQLPWFARLARASVAAELKEPYIAAARSFGTKGHQLIFGNVLPNTVTPLISQASYALGVAIVAEAGVSYLGLGVQPPDSSWGIMLSDGQSLATQGAWWLVAVPAAGIFLSVLAYNYLADRIRDALDPRTLVSTTQVLES